MARHISNWELDGSAEVKASQVRAVRECSIGIFVIPSQDLNYSVIRYWSHLKRRLQVSEHWQMKCIRGCWSKRRTLSKSYDKSSRLLPMTTVSCLVSWDLVAWQCHSRSCPQLGQALRERGCSSWRHLWILHILYNWPISWIHSEAANSYPSQTNTRHPRRMSYSRRPAVVGPDGLRCYISSPDSK